MTLLKITLKNTSLWLLLFGISLTQGCDSAQKKPETAAQLIQAKKSDQSDCIQLAQWRIPGQGVTTNAEVIAKAAKSDVVLLGETHVNADHHRWQLQMLTSLYAVRPNMMIGFEMFPRRVQPILDKWVAGEYADEKAFLRAVGWGRVWSTDANLYLPLFHFARMNKIPMLALNIESSLRRKISKKGFDGVPIEEREGVTHPAKASDAYLDYLLPIYQQHDRKDKKEKPGKDDPDFQRFITTQQLWDRAMAQILDDALDDAPTDNKPLVVGIMGMGHVQNGFGVPHQLKDLGTDDVAMLIPWDINRSCKNLTPGIADAVFGVLPHLAELSPAPKYQRLGIRFEMAKGGARVLQVVKDSIAQKTTLQDADVITKMAGVPVKNTEDVINIVKRQAPGTWMPLTVKRKNKTIELVAKFPPLKK